MNDALIKMAFDAGLSFNEDLQKFAESIIQECMRQIRKDENGLASDAIGRIAEYFGVE